MTLVNGSLAGALAISLVLAGPVPASPAAPVAAQPHPQPAEQAVTLVTGDRVFVRTGPDGRPMLRLAPGKGREQIQFFQYAAGRHQYVLPSDAAPLVTAGRLDRRLFDVTGLLAQGYGDERRADLPLLVRSTGQFGGSGARVLRTYRHQPLAGLSAPKSELDDFWRATRQSPPQRLWLDGKLRLALDQSVPHVGAPAAWQRGLTGAGVTAAVLDSGYDTTHPDLAGAVAEAKNFTDDPAGVDDTVGHGTHVATILAGRGTASGGRYTGVAPQAKLLVGKVCRETEEGGCPESAILAGMEWAAERGARVVNVSLNGEPTDGTDPLSAAVNALTERYGTLFVASAGNHYPDEPGESMVSTPATADAALAVANLTRDDRLNEQSNQGPRVGDFAVKPDLAAPGTDIVAGRAARGVLGEAVDEHHTRMSGTSMASPHVAGAAAILAQQHPDWRAGQLKAALLSTATPVPDLSVYAQGGGLVDIARATGQPVWASPGSVSLGYFRWPNASAPPASHTVTYHNDGDTALTLALELSMTDAGGAPAADGMFTVDASEVTVPAGGTAEVTVTATPGPGRTGRYGGQLVARGGDTVVRTALGAYQEPERYDLVVRTTDRTGARPYEYQPVVIVADIDSGQTWEPAASGGVAQVRVPSGRYAVWVGIPTGPTGTEKPSTTLAFVPEVSLTKDVTLDLDARQGKPVRAVVDRPDARSNGTETFGVRQLIAGELAGAYGGTTNEARQFVLPQPGTAAGFEWYHASTLLEPEIRLDVTGRGGYAVPTTYVDTTYTPRFVGDETLLAVDAGRGTPADLATVDVRGRLALLTLDRPGEIDALPERVAAVAAAGGRAVQLATYHRPSNMEEPLALPTMVSDTPAGLRLVQDARTAPVPVRLRGTDGSAYQYNLLVGGKGEVPADLNLRVRDRDLAAVTTPYSAQAVERAVGTLYTRPSGVPGWTSPVRIGMPIRRVEYFSPDTLWEQQLRHEASDDGSLPWGGELRADRGPYRAGRYAEAWNAGPFGPSVGLAEWMGEGFLGVRLPLFSDSTPTHDGLAVPHFGEDTGSVVVRRDGTEIGRAEEPGGAVIEAAKAGGGYEIETTAARSAPWTTLTSRVRATWNFHWADPDQPAPLLAVRFTAAGLDEHNRAAAGRQRLGVWVEQAVPGPVREVAVQVSYDDGSTWRRLPLRKQGSRWVALLDHPPGSYVSLRASAEDAAGNAVTQEVIRAYAVR